MFLHYALGMLTIMAIILVVVIVVGFVKVVNLKKDVNILFKEIEVTNNDIINRISDVQDSFENIVTDIYRQMEENIQHCNSYTDKRIDKLNSKNN